MAAATMSAAALVERRLDFLTITSTDAKNKGFLIQLGDECLNDLGPEDGELREWHWRGYNGTHVGWLTFGERPDSTILQLSGRAADDYFDKAWPLASNVTRIDLCVTVHLPTVEEDLADECYSAALEWRRHRGTGPEYSYRRSSAGGSTVYVGSPSSDVIGRLYNKYAESGIDEYQRCWRYEVQTRGKLARSIADAYRASGDRGAYVEQVVHNYFAHRGIPPRFAIGRTDLQLRTIRPRTDLATRLLWLTNQVRPAVRKLVAAGYELAVLEALGLTTATRDYYRRESGVWEEPHYSELLDGEDSVE